MEKSFTEIMGYKSLLGQNSVFNDENKELENRVVNDTTIDQTLVRYKRNSANGFYYLYDGVFLGNYGTSDEVVLCDKMKTFPKSKTNKKEYYEFYKPVRFKMTNQELNLRAFMATIKQTENNANTALPYNAKHGFKDGKLVTFTDKSYEKAPEDYAEHPYKDAKGASAAGAYQMTNSTFKSQKERNGELIKDFGPNSQDYAVIEVFKGVEAYVLIIAGNMDKAVPKLIKDKWGNTQFASLPGGGQEAKSMTMVKLKEMFKINVANELNKNSNISLKIGETIK